MVIYNIHTNGPSSQMVIEVMNDSVLIDAESIAYIVGELELNANNGGWHNMFLSYCIGKKYFRPVYHGTGKIYLKPTLGTYYKFNLQEQEQLVINNNAFVACRTTINLKPRIKPSLDKFFSGTSSVEMLASGSGNLVILMPGAVAEQTLNNQKFSVYAGEIAAYTPSLKVSHHLAGHGWLSAAKKMISEYSGVGSIFFSPHPNKGTSFKTKGN